MDIENKSLLLYSGTIFLYSDFFRDYDHQNYSHLLLRFYQRVKLPRGLVRLKLPQMLALGESGWLGVTFVG